MSRGGMQKQRPIIELVVSAFAAVAAVWSWFGAQSVVTVAPILPGEPQTTSVAFSPPMLVVMLLLATVAGVLAVDGLARLRRLAHVNVGTPAVLDPAKGSGLRST